MYKNLVYNFILYIVQYRVYKLESVEFTVNMVKCTVGTESLR